jgi:hypothetical protein
MERKAQRKGTTQALQIIILSITQPERKVSLDNVK